MVIYRVYIPKTTTFLRTQKKIMNNEEPHGKLNYFIIKNHSALLKDKEIALKNTKRPHC